MTKNAGLERHAEAILRATGRLNPDYYMDDRLSPNERQAILAACQALRDEGYQAGRADMAKEIGPYMKVDPAAIMPQSSGIGAAKLGEGA